MYLKQKSTLNKPLLFLEIFLDKENFDKYEKDFYENPINPSFTANRKEGYIEYSDDVYVNEPDVLRRYYFKDKVLDILTYEVSNTIGLIKDKLQEIHNSGNSTFNFTNDTKSKIISLVKLVNTNNKLHFEILPLLQEIYKALQKVDKQKLLTRKPFKFTDISNGYFRPKITGSQLGKIYKVALDLQIFDKDVVSKDDFLSVFIHPNPKSIENIIVFNVDNRRALYFISCIQRFFDNLTPSAISYSESFFSKNASTKLKQNNIDQVNNYLRKADISKYEKILIAIRMMEGNPKF